MSFSGLHNFSSCLWRFLVRIYLKVSSFFFLTEKDFCEGYSLRYLLMWKSIKDFFVDFNGSLTELQQKRHWFALWGSTWTPGIQNKPLLYIPSCTTKWFRRMCNLKQTHSFVKGTNWVGLMCRGIAWHALCNGSISSIAFLIHLSLLLVPISAKLLKKNLLILGRGEYLALNKVYSSW